MARGLFGQCEGNEKRDQAAQFGDHLLDNHLVEGRYVAVLRRMVKEKDWNRVTNYTNKLRTEGHGKARVDSMLTRAMVGLKL